MLSVPVSAGPALRAAWDVLWGNVALLRSTFALVPEPGRHIRDNLPLPWTEHSATVAADAIAVWVETIRCEPLDVQTGPCMRLDWCPVQGREEAVLAWTCHQLLLDPDSMATLLRQVWTQAGLAPAATEDGSGQWSDGQIALPTGDEPGYWIQRLHQLKPAPRLPWSEPGGESGVVCQQHVLAPSVHEALVKRWGADFEAMLHAAWAVLLYRHSGEQDVVFGHVCRGADTGIGMLSDLLPFRIDVDPGAVFADWVPQVSATLSDDSRQGRIGLAGVWRAAGLSHEAMFASVFEVASQRWFNLPVTAPGFRTDTGLPLHMLADCDESLTLTALVEQPQLSAAAATRLLERFAVMLAAIAEQPEQAIGDLEWCTDADTAALEAANQTTAAIPSWSSVDAWFRMQAQQVPDQLAVQCGTRQLSYQALDRAVDALAADLWAKGLDAGQRIALTVGRSESMVIGLLAIWRIGAAYVPCDPRYPGDRLVQMWEDGAVAAIVTEAALEATLPTFDAPRIYLDRAEMADGLVGLVQPLRESPEGAGAAAYVIFTSGSTGRPKGIEVTQRNVLNFLASMQQRPGLSSDDVLLAVTTMSFDIAVLELFLPLVTGATVVLADEDDVLDVHRLAALIKRHSVNVLQATPTTYRLLLTAQWQPPADFRALVGGEALDADLAARLLDLQPDFSLWNMYGPTETTVWSTCDAVTSADISIGAPIANTTCHVVSPAGETLPPGVIGELCIGGAGVTNGYVQQPERTAERFVELDGERVYRTGDLACWRDDGRLQCFGRLDFQIKIRGYRVEPGEIEACLAQHAAVGQAVVVVREQAGLPMLAAYVTSSSVVADTLRDWVAERLPPQMVPAVVIPIETFPLTPNGKIDRKALPAPAVERTLEPADLGGLEAEIAAIWRDALGHGQFSEQDSFFDLGGDSLRVMEMLAPLDALARRQGRQISVADIFRLSTIARLAEHIRQEPSQQAAQTEETDERASRRRAAMQGRRRRT